MTLDADRAAGDLADLVVGHAEVYADSQTSPRVEATSPNLGLVLGSAGDSLVPAVDAEASETRSGAALVGLPGVNDADGSGLTNAEESTADTDPSARDADNDGLHDRVEVNALRTGPRVVPSNNGDDSWVLGKTIDQPAAQGHRPRWPCRQGRGRRQPHHGRLSVHVGPDARGHRLRRGLQRDQGERRRRPLGHPLDSSFPAQRPGADGGAAMLIPGSSTFRA